MFAKNPKIRSWCWLHAPLNAWPRFLQGLRIAFVSAQQPAASLCHLWPDFQTISIPSRNTVTHNLLPVSKETTFLWKSGPDGQCQSVLEKPIMPSKYWDLHLRTMNGMTAPGGTWTLLSLIIRGIHAKSHHNSLCWYKLRSPKVLIWVIPFVFFEN